MDTEVDMKDLSNVYLGAFHSEYPTSGSFREEVVSACIGGVSLIFIVRASAHAGCS